MPAPSTLDSVKVLGVESSAQGSQNYASPTELDPHQDAASLAGVHIQDTSVSQSDKSVYIDRTAGGLRLTDGTAQRLLSELMAVTDGSAQSHSASRGLEHFLAGEGPGPGIAPSGAYLQRTYQGPLLTNEIWYTNSNATVRILARTLSYPSGSVLPTSQTLTIYSATGGALKSCTDTYTWQNALLTSALRAWS